MEYTVNLKEAKEDIQLLGGKASNLIKLIKYGVKVPPGFVLNTKSFKEFVEDNQIQSEIKDIFSKEYYPKDVIDISSKIKKLYLGINLPERIIKEIKRMYSQVFANLEKGCSYVVRSSANFEDLSEFSFAGQAQSFLNNHNIDDIILSIKKCWASLFSPQALLYLLQLKKKKITISPKDLKMAVIVQKMINPQVSGVLFTANVINNNKNQMMINSSWGLGEVITGNLVIPDLIILNKIKFDIVKTVIGKKEKLLIANPNDMSTILTETEKTLQEQCSLNRTQLKQLHNLGIKLEIFFNYPQDIEWAIENNTIYTLQSRPITTLADGKP